MWISPFEREADFGAPKTYLVPQFLRYRLEILAQGSYIVGAETVGSNFWILDFGFFWKFLKKILPKFFSKISKKIQNSKIWSYSLCPQDLRALCQNFKSISQKLWKKIDFWCFKVGLSLERRNSQFSVILLVF